MMTEKQKKTIKTYIMDYDLDEYTFEYLYRKIYKIPVKTYFEGLIDRFKYKIMKKLISFTLSYFLFYLGHIVYLIFVQYGMCYNTYNWLMNNSEKIQSWGGNKRPWKQINNEKN